MISFFFKIGKAFLKYSNHPITIPRVHYTRLVDQIYESTGKKTTKVRIIPPNRKILNGKIYYGIAGYGPFYQIKVLGSYPSDHFGNVKIGSILQVTIKKIGDKIYVIIEEGIKLAMKIDLTSQI
jgi:hypothetical protein